MTDFSKRENYFLALLISLFIFSNFAVNADEKNNISFNEFFLINGKTNYSRTIAALTVNKVKYLNVVDIFRYLKISYNWEPFSTTLELSNETYKLRLKNNCEYCLLNNSLIKNDNPFYIVSGKVFVNARLIALFKNAVIRHELNCIIFNDRVNEINPEDNKLNEIINSVSQAGIKNSSTTGFLKFGKITKIIIDPGHGGKDPGALSYSKKFSEKEIVLEVAKKIRQSILQSIPDVTVLLARDSDKTLYLMERAQFANSNKGDLFISLHCNAGSNSASGVETYYFSLSEEDETERTVRLLENKSEFISKPGESYNTIDFITADMTQINHVNASISFASLIQRKILEKNLSRNRGIKKARFFVLKDVYMPSALIEIGFISNKNEEEALMNETFQTELANAITEAIKQLR